MSVGFLVFLCKVNRISRTNPLEVIGSFLYREARLKDDPTCPTSLGGGCFYGRMDIRIMISLKDVMRTY